MASKTLFDTIIIGGGPGGLSTALGLCRQSRTCLVISHKVFRNDGIEASHAVLGHDHTHPQEIWAKARQQIDRYGTTSYAEDEVVSAKQEELPQWNGHKGFLVRSKSGQSWLGKTLVLAMGVKDIFPQIEGYKENWPRNIYQCLFCDGWERRNTKKVVLAAPIGNGMVPAMMASMSLGMDKERAEDGSTKVTILTDGPFNLETANFEPSVVRQLKAVMARGVKIDQRKIVALEDSEPLEGVNVRLKDENGQEEKVHFGFIVHKPRTELNGQDIIQDLGVETEKTPHGDAVKVIAPFQGTNIPGLFAAGDSGVQMTHVTTAMASGVSAAGGIVHYLSRLDDGDALAAAGLE
ncbi:uncharacterized protein DFL_008433 [Arthrobotrys flagrans]|uniref:FAD/NAD(P)-binding domain-containing protein n=1 Tax=Arthrobotrys flagrans TaxID=97331 RepID=A0A436ZNQ9_ARTFL|nr:hypothetical protein DFL_008433 [Arthrobotrys flagrans]